MGADELHFGGDHERVRSAALDAVAHHRPLLRSAKDGRRLSDAMLPLFRLRPPLGFGVLTTTGARTGQPRPKCVRVIRDGSTAFLVALRPPVLAIEKPGVVAAWVWNIRADPHVTLRVRGQTLSAAAREITDRDELRRAHSALSDTFHPFDLGECAVHLRGLPSRAKARELHRYWFATGIPVALDIATGGD